MNRGARRQDVFVDDEIRQIFLGVLAELPRFSVRIHGYALMPNHYHLMMESVTGDLPRAMRHLGAEFTRRLNHRQAWDGPVFRGRYHNRLVDTDAYWRHLLVYVHANPARAGLDCAGNALWTSHAAYLGQSPRPDWLTTAELQGLFGEGADYQAYFKGVTSGELAHPADFDAARLWEPGSTGVVAVPNLAAPSLALADALAQVSLATGQPLPDLLATPRGPRGNSANWLAAWWLSRQCGIDHGKIAAALGIGHSTVSRRVARVEERRALDPELRAWVASLRAIAGEARRP